MHTRQQNASGILIPANSAADWTTGEDWGSGGGGGGVCVCGGGGGGGGG